MTETVLSARTDRSRPQAPRDEDRPALAARRQEMLAAARHLAALAVRLEDLGADPLARALAAAIVERFDRLLPEARAREERRLLPALERGGDGRGARVAACLRVDLAWLAANWRELRPLIDGVAQGLSWMDPDSLRDGAELFCTLVAEHAARLAAAEDLDQPRTPAGGDAHVSEPF